MGTRTEFQSFYTKSDPILNYMVSRLDLRDGDSVLEPCGGDGAFVDKILVKNPSTRIDVMELNPDAVSVLNGKYARMGNILIKETDTLLDRDILNHTYLYDKIIGNPPYGAHIEQTKRDELAKLYANIYTKESYTLFLYTCIKCLKEGGILSFIVPDTFLSLNRHKAIRQFILKNTQIEDLLLIPSSFFPGVNFGYANLCIITLKRTKSQQTNLEHEFPIKKNYLNVNMIGIPSCEKIQYVKQSEIFYHIDSSFLISSDERINQLINNSSLPRIGDIAYCVTGFYSGNDKDYLKAVNHEIRNAKRYEVIRKEEICHRRLTEQEMVSGVSGSACFVPVVKGGNTKYVKPDEWFMNWSERAVREYRASRKCRFQNSDFYFSNHGVALPMIRSGRMTAALINGRLIDQSIVGVFPKDRKLEYYLLAFFNSTVSTKLIDVVNPSANNSANYIKKLPIVVPSEKQLDSVNKIVVSILNKIKSGDYSYDTEERQLDIIFENIYKLK